MRRSVSHNLVFLNAPASFQHMRGIICFVMACLTVGTIHATPKAHHVAFGEWRSVPWSLSTKQQKVSVLKIRGLYVDNRLREHTIGPARDITDRMFVVQRVFRVNDALADEKQPRWRWELGGWMSVDRSTGRISQLHLPAFNATGSHVSWYRDYAAYCGTSDDNTKLYGIVVQLGRRKPLWRQLLTKGEQANLGCPAPTWQREPIQVTFNTERGGAVTYAIAPPEPPTAAENQANKAE